MGTVVVLSCVGSRDLRYLIDDAGVTRWVPLRGATEDRTAPAHRVAAELIGRYSLQPQECPPTLRGITRVLLAHSAQERHRFAYPILRPAVRRIIAQHGRIDFLGLIVTDQEPRAGRWHEDDTVHAGALLADLVRGEFPDSIDRVQPDFLVIRETPNSRDHMYRLLAGHLRRELPARPAMRVIVLNTGGTPAMSDALQQQAMHLYRKMSQVLAVREPAEVLTGREEGEVAEIPLDLYTKDVVRRTASAMIERFNYAGALQVLEEFDASGREWDPLLLGLLKYAIARVNLDFATADFILSGWEGNDRAQRLLRSLPQDDLLSRAGEVYFLIGMAVQQERYLDALHRIVQFYECLRRAWVFSQFIPELRSWELSRTVPAKAVADAYPDLARELDRSAASSRYPKATKVGSGWLLDSSTNVTMFNAARLSRDDDVSRLLGNPYWHDVQNKRNATIHYPTGVSADDFARLRKLPKRMRHFGSEDLLEAMRGALNDLRRRCGLPEVGSDPFHQLNALITPLLEAPACVL